MASSNEQYNAVTGDWESTLNLPTGDIRFAIQIKTDESGNLVGDLAIPDRKIFGLALDTVSLTGMKFSFYLLIEQAYFQGILEKTGDTITGTWNQAGQSLPISFYRLKDELVTYQRPQTPVPPFAYDVEEVVIQNSIDDLALHGTLTVPMRDEQVPAVLLLSVAGPNDRDQSFAGHKSFHVLADYLTKNGIAVLRMDDRGVGKSEGNLFTSTMKDFSEDALAAVKFLQERNEIHQEKVGLIGMSEGAGVAALAASESENVAFVIMLSGMGLPGDEAISGQLHALSVKAGFSEQQIESMLEAARSIWNILHEEPDNSRASQQLKLILESGKFTAPPEAVQMMPTDIEDQIRIYTSDWYRYQISFDPQPVLEKLQCPTLVLSGQLDPILPPSDNLPAIHQALLKAGNPDYTISLIPGINHIMQTAKSGLPSEYSKIEETISPLILKTILSWLEVRFSL